MPNIFTAGYHSPQHIFLLQILKALMAVRGKNGVDKPAGAKNEYFKEVLDFTGVFSFSI